MWKNSNCEKANLNIKIDKVKDGTVFVTIDDVWFEITIQNLMLLINGEVVAFKLEYQSDNVY